MTITATTAPTYTPPTIESEVDKFYGRTMNRYNEQGFEPAYSYFKGIIRTNLRTQDAVQMLLDRLPSEFTPKFEEEKQAEQEAKAKCEAEAKVRAEAEATWHVKVDTYWREHPVKALTELPGNDASELFDFLAAYHVTEVQYDFACDYWPDGDFSGFQDQSISVQFEDDDPGMDLYDIPDEESEIADTLTDVIHELGYDYANNCKGQLNVGSVTFDVATRTISASAECEVTTTETFEQSWKV